MQTCKIANIKICKLANHNYYLKIAKMHKCNYSKMQNANMQTCKHCNSAKMQNVRLRKNNCKNTKCKIYKKMQKCKI